MDDNNSNQVRKAARKGGLRLVKDSEDAAPEAPAEAVANPRRYKSHLATVLSAYADAIDRDVELILSV